MPESNSISDAASLLLHSWFHSETIDAQPGLPRCITQPRSGSRIAAANMDEQLACLGDLKWQRVIRLARDHRTHTALNAGPFDERCGQIPRRFGGQGAGRTAVRREQTGRQQRQPPSTSLYYVISYLDHRSSPNS